MPRHKLGNAIRVGDGLFPAKKFEICAGMNKNNQLKIISVWSVWFLILKKKQVFEFLVLKFQEPHSNTICCFLMLSSPSLTVTLSGVLEGHHQETFLFVGQLCLKAVVNQKILMKCSITKVWSISTYYFTAFILFFPYISR